MKDREARGATVYGVTKSETRLSDRTTRSPSLSPLGSFIISCTVPRYKFLPCHLQATSWAALPQAPRSLYKAHLSIKDVLGQCSWTFSLFSGSCLSAGSKLCAWLHTHHYGLNICILQKLIRWSPNLWYAGSRVGGQFREVIRFKWGQDSGGPMMKLTTMKLTTMKLTSL